MYNLSLSECFFKLRETRGNVKTILTHFFRLPTEADWTAYLRGRGFMGFSKGRDTFEFQNVMQEEDEALWKSLIVRVEGYAYKGENLMKLDGWQERIPIQHKLQAVGGFFIFNREDAPSEEMMETGTVLDLGDESGIPMKFAAVQNDNEEVVSFVFKNPETTDYVKFNRMMTKVQYTRTKQRNVSAIKIPVNLGVFEELFDKLILGVEGYSFGAEKPSVWRPLIPLYHKREAVRELFAGSLREEEGERD